MIRRTLNQDRALAWWCKDKGLIPQLSAHPMYMFMEKETGRESEANIQTIVSSWNEMQKTQELERKQSRRTRIRR